MKAVSIISASPGSFECRGGMAEWSIAPDLKSGMPARASWVRILLPPPRHQAIAPRLQRCIARHVGTGVVPPHSLFQSPAQSVADVRGRHMTAHRAAPEHFLALCVRKMEGYAEYQLGPDFVRSTIVPRTVDRAPMLSPPAGSPVVGVYETKLARGRPELSQGPVVIPEQATGPIQRK